MRPRVKASPKIIPAASAGATFETLLSLRDRLAKHGVPPLGEWWLDALAEWYASASALTLGVCAGRGSAKSHALYLVTLNETLFGDFFVPPGERHSATLTSRLVEDAAKGVRIINRWLGFLAIRHATTDGLIELADTPRDIRISAASIAANSGARAFFDGNDETGKWPSQGAIVVDADEVLTSKAALTATHPNARRMIVSSPFLDSGPFYELITAGTNPDQVVRQAPTWIATDGRITEEQTRRKEKNARRHAREYGAIFGAAWESGFFADLIEPCIVKGRADWAVQEGTRYAVALDPAFRVDGCAVAVAHHEQDGVIVVDYVDVIEPEHPGVKLEPTQALEKVKEIATEYGETIVYSDQASFDALAALAQRIDLYLSEDPWSASSKAKLYDLVRTLMRDRKIMLPDDAGLRRELAGIGTRLLPSGHEQVTGRSGCRDDRVSALVMAVCRAAQLPARVKSTRRRRARGASLATDGFRDFSGTPFDTGRGPREATYPVHEVPTSFSPAGAQGPSRVTIGSGARKPGGGGGAFDDFGDY